MAALLREQFSGFTMVELAQKVADVGVKGWRSLSELGAAAGGVGRQSR